MLEVVVVCLLFPAARQRRKEEDSGEPAIAFMGTFASSLVETSLGVWLLLGVDTPTVQHRSHECFYVTGT